MRGIRVPPILETIWWSRRKEGAAWCHESCDETTSERDIETWFLGR
jgi:hypothetical protein